MLTENKVGALLVEDATIAEPILYRRLQRGDGLLRLPLDGVDAGHVVGHPGVVGVYPQGALGPLQSPLLLTNPAQSTGAHGDRAGVVRVEFDVLLDHPKRPAVGCLRIAVSLEGWDGGRDLAQPSPYAM